MNVVASLIEYMVVFLVPGTRWQRLGRLERSGGRIRAFDVHEFVLVGGFLLRVTPFVHSILSVVSGTQN